MKFIESDRTLAGVLFLTGSTLFFLAMMCGEVLAPGYSVHNNPVSDLGVIPETALLFNVMVILLGVLTLIGGLFLHRDRPDRRVTIIFALAGLGAIGVGIFTLDSGLHGLFALLSFIAFNVLAIVMAARLNGPMRVVSYVLGVIGLIGLVLHASSDFGIMDLDGPIGPGGMERIIIYPPLIWLIAFSGYLMARSGSKDDIAAQE